MSLNKLTIPIAGMHCRSCEMLIEDSLEKVSGIKKISVSFKRGEAELFYSGKKPSLDAIEEKIRKAGYSIGVPGKQPFFSQNISDYQDLGVAAIFLLGIYIILNNLGLTNINIGSASNPSSLPVVFLVGITAGLSTCMALVGGLVLGISARHSEKHPEATPMQKFRPHLFFNAGRIASYTVLGGALGSIGSFLQLSGQTLGFMTIAVGFVMLMLGLKLTGIFPRLENGGISLPKGISQLLGIKKHEKEYSHRSSSIMGGLTFFLPCGFTQAMQLYAISTGSFTRGALIMGIFALGTAPGLLGVGGISSLVKGIFAKRFFKFSGILVVLLAMFNIANGYNLTGISLGSISNGNSIQQAVDPNVTLENGVQVVRMTESSSGYSPNKFTIKKGVPVKWVITAKDPYSCAASIFMSKYNIRKSLKSGENIIEFTPTEAGRLPFSCAMGMFTGSFNVVDDNGNGAAVSDSEDTTPEPSVPKAGGCGGGAAASDGTTKSAPSCGSGSGGGCGGCGGGKPVTPSQGTVESAPSKDSASSNEQLINTTYTYDEDIKPNTFKVKVGQPVRFVIDVKDDGYGCMSTIMIPGLYDTPELLENGSKIVMTFTPTEKGTFNITCAMGVPRGTVTVE